MFITHLSFKAIFLFKKHLDPCNETLIILFHYPTCEENATIDPVFPYYTLAGNPHTYMKQKSYSQ